MSNPSLPQAISLLTRVKDKGLSLGRLEAHFDAGLLSDLFDVDPRKVDRAEFRKVIGHPDVLPTFTEKFALLADLGLITVPDDYVHKTRLDSFKTKYQDGKKKAFYFYNDAIIDANFPNPSCVLKPGDKLRVRAFKQVVSGTTTSEERMAFLASQKAVHTGAQGATLVFEQKREELQKGYWYASFDEKDHLWEDARGRRRVPYVFANSDGGFRFDLGDFGDVWYGHDAFLCFCDEQSLVA